MIKRIYYYFKLKELLKMKELMPFVKWRLLLSGYKMGSLLVFCMCHWRVPMWLDTIINYYYLREEAFEYAKDSNLAETIVKRYNQANDFWHKNVKL